MIIFDLDGTLANCEHRRHFVDPTKIINTTYGNSDWIRSESPEGEFLSYVNIRQPIKFKPNWPAFYDACDLDTPIEPVISVLGDLFKLNQIEIWSSRCESVRDKTIEWLEKYTIFSSAPDLDIPILKMRPIGDNTSDDVLKERWYDRHNVEHPRENIEFVFDSDPKSIAMWRRRGIFVFDCAQSDGEF
jgi:hypothetical protein